ncbi:hypothetical protein D3C74_140300 [compost metagenome]
MGKISDRINLLEKELNLEQDSSARRLLIIRINRLKNSINVNSSYPRGKVYQENRQEHQDTLLQNLQDGE